MSSVPGGPGAVTVVPIESADPHPSPVTSRQVQTSGANLFTIQRGTGSPSIVLLHGVTANAWVWEPVMDLLAQSYRVVAVDQRGHGRTGGVRDGAYDAASYARDILELAVALGGDPVVIAGHSLGSRNALHAAVMSPDLVAGVVAIDFTPFIEDAVFDSLQKRVDAGSKGFADLDEVRDYLRGRYPRLPSDAIERRTVNGYTTLRTGLVRPLADTEAMTRTCVGLRSDLSKVVRDVSVPLVLVRGRDSTLVSPEAFAATCRLRPDVPAIVVDDADHYVPEEQPEVVARIIADMAEAVSGKSSEEGARS
jgi:2-(acetamidomethylene)succinate hydrolase